MVSCTHILLPGSCGHCGVASQDASRECVNENTPELINKATGQLDPKKTKQLNNHKCWWISEWLWRSRGGLWSGHWPCNQSDPWSFMPEKLLWVSGCLPEKWGTCERSHLQDKVASTCDRYHVDFWLPLMCTHTCAHTHKYSRYCVVAHAYHLRIWVAEARETVWIQGHPGHHNDFKTNVDYNETLSTKQNQKWAH